MASFSSKIVILGLKLTGIKKAFSKDPIDYVKLRKSDVKNPPKKFAKNFNISRLLILKTTITQIYQTEEKQSKKLLIFIHGGAFVYGPAKHHWDSIFSILKQTNSDCWMIDYPKSPEVDIVEISKNIDAVYQKATENYLAEDIILIGDSVGGNLCMSLTQRLIKNKEKTPQQLILITPVFDASMSNSKIDIIDKKDPILSKNGVLSSKKICANGLPLKNELISPIYGNFTNFPKTTLFIGGRDIMYPDSKLAIEKMRSEHINLEIIENTKMPHIWPLLPIMKESKIALNKIMKTISLFLITIFLFTNCQSVKKKASSNQQESNSLNRKWMLVKLDSISRNALIKHKVFIDLTEKKTSGNAYAGCNNINFQYNANKDSSIRFSNIISTRMYCEKTNNIEQLLINGLENTKSYNTKNQFLLLITKSNDTIKCVAEDWD